MYLSAMKSISNIFFTWGTHPSRPSAHILSHIGCQVRSKDKLHHPKSLWLLQLVSEMYVSLVATLYQCRYQMSTNTYFSNANDSIEPHEFRVSTTIYESNRASKSLFKYDSSIRQIRRSPNIQPTMISLDRCIFCFQCNRSIAPHNIPIINFHVQFHYYVTIY